MKHIENLIGDIEEVVTSKDLKVDDETKEKLIQECLKDIEGNLREFLEVRQERDSFTLRMSNIGVAKRKLWYDKHGDNEKEEMPARLLLTFLQGHILEAVLLMLVEMSGHEISNKQTEVKVEGIVGHMDCVIDDCLIDVKTAAPYSYKEKFVNGGLLEGKDPFGYSLQADSYAHALGLERRGWLVMNKATGELNLLMNDSFINNAVGDIQATKEALEQDTPPDRCYNDKEDGKAGNRILGSDCGYCNHKIHCWPGLRAFKYSNGLKWFTHVVKEPKVEELSLS
jgi:hypothetical protein